MKLLPPAHCLILCLSLGACGLLPKPQANGSEHRQAEPSLYVGQIASLHLDQDFVLIRRTPTVSVATGTILISSGPGGELANLRVTGEHLGLMIAADVQSGRPQLGDSVNRSAVESEDTDPDSVR